MIPSKKLSGDEEWSYLDRLLAILRAARLNLHYPDVRRVSVHLGAMHPRVHRGLYDGVEIDLRSGLPHYKEWTRVQSDVRLAEKMLCDLGERRDLEVRAKKSELHQRQLIKHDYYSAIRGQALAELGGMQVDLRRIEAGSRRSIWPCARRPRPAPTPRSARSRWGQSSPSMRCCAARSWSLPAGACGR